MHTTNGHDSVDSPLHGKTRIGDKFFVYFFFYYQSLVFQINFVCVNQFVLNQSDTRNDQPKEKLTIKR